MRIFGNLLKVGLHLALMVSLGWLTHTHKFEGNYTKEISLVVNFVFAALGASTVLTWAKKRKVSEPPFEKQFLPATLTAAESAASTAKIDKEVTPRTNGIN